MSQLNDPIQFKASFDTLHGDSEGNVSLKLTLPASEAAKAARFLVMGQIIFEVVATPVDVVAKNTTKM